MRKEEPPNNDTYGSSTTCTAPRTPFNTTQPLHHPNEEEEGRNDEEAVRGNDKHAEGGNEEEGGNAKERRGETTQRRGHNDAEEVTQQRG